MRFKKDLAIKIIQGKKTQTIRKDSKIKVGKTYAVQIGPKPPVAYIKIIDRKEITLEKLTDKDAEREGFKNLIEFKKYWTDILKFNWNPKDKYYVYRFKLVKIIKENIENRGLKEYL